MLDSMAQNSKSIRCLVTGLVLCVFISNFVVKAQWVVDDEGCFTPDGASGDCIGIKQCKPIIDFLARAPKPLSEPVKKKLNSYTCSYEANTVKVCCPDTPIKIDDKIPPESLQNTEPQPPDVSNHRNYNLLPKDCGYIPSDQKIINGQNASLNEFPWMALLSYNTKNGPQFRCGGTIINKKWILTAAHCVSNLKEPLLGVRVGEHNILTKTDCETLEDGSTRCADPVQDLAIEKVIPHPNFNISVISNDIALLKVSTMNLSVGRTSSILQKVTIDVIVRDQCQTAYKKSTNVQLTHKQLCAGGKKRQDSCSGDSGGPLHVASYLSEETRYVQQGIVSFGPRECGLENFPGVYTKIAYYMDWILDNITP
ncbi:serine protease easter-like [Anoplophora glabripennis]|uniref:serine protease easter-like n=1 Tax=Anoplophora glabripennis TaxID=217634 RepID=UPI000873725A|nr:serine protease easter-like [Anoplophora glabripennis]